MPKTETKRTLKVAVKNALQASTPENSVLEIYFLDYIENEWTYDWWCEMYVEEDIVQELLDWINTANPQIVRCIINSQGGDADKGIAVYNILKAKGFIVEVDIIGFAGSIATVIACAGSKGKIRMARNGFYVIHEAWCSSYGNAANLRQQADVLDMYTDQICDIYEHNNRKGKKLAEFRALIANGDYWMTGTQALEMGFIDEIYNDNNDFQVAACIQTLDKHYRNRPKNIVLPQTASAVEEEQLAADVAKSNNSLTQKIYNELMNIKAKVAAALGKPGATKNETAPAGGGAAVQTTETAAPDNFVEQVMNAMTKPLEDFADSIQAEVEEYTGSMEERVFNKLKETYEERIGKLEQVNNSLTETNADLANKVAGIAGAESGVGTSGAAKNEVPVGRWRN